MNIITVPAGRSPYEARLNNARKGTRSITRFRQPPNRSVGEAVGHFSDIYQSPPTFVCNFSEGKNFKLVGGSMRSKARRRSRINNHVRTMEHFGINAVYEVIDRAPHNRADFIFEPETRNQEVLDYLAGKISKKEAMLISARRQMKDADWVPSVDGVALMAYTAGSLSDEEFGKIRARKENGMDVKDCLAMIKERWNPHGVLSNL